MHLEALRVLGLVAISVCLDLFEHLLVVLILDCAVFGCVEPVAAKCITADVPHEHLLVELEVQ